MSELLSILIQLHATQDEQDKIFAFARVESNFKWNAVGDKGAAKGLFQFHKARWEEWTNCPYSYIDTPTGHRKQVQIMLEIIRRYLNLIQCANYHNRGFASTVRFAYSKKILKWYNHYRRKVAAVNVRSTSSALSTNE